MVGAFCELCANRFETLDSRSSIYLVNERYLETHKNSDTHKATLQVIGPIKPTKFRKSIILWTKSLIFRLLEITIWEGIFLQNDLPLNLVDTLKQRDISSYVR